MTEKRLLRIFKPIFLINAFEIITGKKICLNNQLELHMHLNMVLMQWNIGEMISMTEKQFYLNEGEVGILKILHLKEDNEAIYHTSSKSDMKIVVELLNTLSDENEQLKAQLYCDSDEGVCIICKHHYLEKGKTYEKYYISKCKKGHEQCSKRDLKYCDDFELKEGDV